MLSGTSRKRSDPAQSVLKTYGKHLPTWDMPPIMNPSTAQALRAINRRFYRECAAAFSETRTRPWPGFETVLAHCPQSLRVLDVGCGNGRFAYSLAATHTRTLHVLDYLGVDESPDLLRIARRRAWPFEARFVQHDVLEAPPPWAPARFSLVAVFGLLHHVPGHLARRTLVQTLGKALVPGGVLALSFFRYDRSPRLMRRIVPEDRAEVPDPCCLEPGDHLIPFGNTGQLRYCHLFDDAELERLTCLPGLRPIDRFTPNRGSDQLNDYLLLTRSRPVMGEA